MFTERELKEILDDLYMDDTVDLLGELPANLVTRILEQVDKEKRVQINMILNYPEDSAGSIMTTEYVSLRRNTTVKQASSRLKNGNPQGDDLYLLYFGWPQTGGYRFGQGPDDHG